MAKAIEFKKKILEEVKISDCERFYFTYCCFKSESTNKFKNTKYKLFNASNKEIEKRTEIIDYVRLSDQFNVLKKIVLNENLRINAICLKIESFIE